MLNHQQLKEILTSELNKTKKDGEALLTVEELSDFLEVYQGEDRIVRSDEIEALIEKEGIRQPIKTGFQDLDNLIGGFYEEQVVVISARPKSGKSSFMLYLADKLKEQNPLILALEQSSRELIEQLKEQDRRIPLFYTPKSIEGVSRTTDWIHLKAIESQYRSQKDGGVPSRVVFIDHFGYITRKRQTSDQMTWEIINTMQELKAIAKQTKTTIVVVVHTTKGDPTEPPTTEHLFGSGGYHQEADTIISLWRETYKENKRLIQTKNVLLQVLANRKKGTTGAVKLTFDEGDFKVNNWKGHDQDSDVVDKEFDDF